MVFHQIFFLKKSTFEKSLNKLKQKKKNNLIVLYKFSNFLFFYLIKKFFLLSYIISHLCKMLWLDIFQVSTITVY